MKQAFILALSLVAFFGCDRPQPRNPGSRDLSVLQPAEQIQVLIFEDLASKLIGTKKADADSPRLFLCLADPPGNPSQQVQTYISHAFPSVRPCSAAAPHERGKVTEQGTGRFGAELRIEPFFILTDGPVTIKASYYVDGRNAEGFTYQVKRVNGRWQIDERRSLWIS